VSKGRADEFHVRLQGSGSVTARTYRAADRRATLVLAHGAGANQLHPFMVRVATGLAERGVETTTFNFSYTEEGRRAPDPAPRLEACFRDVLAEVRARSREERVFLGGKSMGGRMASHLAAAGEPTPGLVFLGYPLHPPGKPEQLRSKHLPDIAAPMLFVQGARDTFGTPDELRPILAGIAARVEVFPVEQGDHSFKVPKRVRSEEQVMRDVMDRVAGFVVQNVLPAPSVTARSPSGTPSTKTSTP
jgi:predicted alpha/beta-hydrolase family hydrolase